MNASVDSFVSVFPTQVEHGCRARTRYGALLVKIGDTPCWYVITASGCFVPLRHRVKQWMLVLHEYREMRTAGGKCRVKQSRAAAVV